VKRGALFALLVAGCGAGNSLEGSLSDQVSLAFDEVQVQRSATALAVAYLRSPPGGGGKDTVLKVVAATEGLDLARGLTIDLTQKLADGTTVRGSFTRAVSGDARRDFPPLVRGLIRFDGAPALGAKVSGSFSALFAQGGSVGAGRTAFGDFSAGVTEAGQ